MKALVENGPLSVSFEVYDDFMMYKTGVYHHTGALKSKQAGGSFDPFEVNQIISELCEDQTSILASSLTTPFCWWVTGRRRVVGRSTG